MEETREIKLGERIRVFKSRSSNWRGKDFAHSKGFVDKIGKISKGIGWTWGKEKRYFIKESCGNLRTGEEKDWAFQRA